MRAKTGETEALDDRALRFQRSKCRIGAAALGDAAHGELASDFPVNCFRTLCQCLGRIGRLQRRPAADKVHLHLGLGQQLLFRPRAHFCLDAVVVGHAPHPHIGKRHRIRRNHIAIGAGVGYRPVHLETLLRLGQITHLQHLVRQLVKRVDTQMRCTASMRRPAGDLECYRRDATGRQRQPVVRHAGAFAREHRIMLAAQRCQQRARARRGDFFVTVDQHRDAAILVEARLLQRCQRMDDRGNTALVIRNAKTIGTITDDTERLLGQHALEVHRVHVRNQQHRAIARTLERRFHHRPGFLGRIVHAVGGRHVRLDQFDIATQCFQSISNIRCDLFQPLAIATARFEVHQIAQGIQRWLLLGGHRLP